MMYPSIKKRATSFDKKLQYALLIFCSSFFIVFRSKSNGVGSLLSKGGSSESNENRKFFKDHFFEDDKRYGANTVHGIVAPGSNGTDLDQRESYGNDNDNKTIGGEPRQNKVVYGLLHLAKTGGTTINGELALNYERVCGNKGYSQDFRNKNQTRYSEDSHYKYKKNVNATRMLSNMRGASDISNDKVPILSLENNTQRIRSNRRFFAPETHGHFFNFYMKEVGFTDCDYVANEIGARFWDKDWHRPLELHVPCRRPFDLFLSMCNHRQVDFTCKPDFKEEFDKCIGGEDKRFDIHELTHPNIHLKCFQSPSKIDAYLDYMGERLQKKEIQTKYKHRNTNFSRKKEQECLLLPENSDYSIQIARHLKTVRSLSEYFTFCSKCFRTENELV